MELDSEHVPARQGCCTALHHLLHGIPHHFTNNSHLVRQLPVEPQRSSRLWERNMDDLILRAAIWQVELGHGVPL